MNPYFREILSVLSRQSDRDEAKVKADEAAARAEKALMMAEERERAAQEKERQAEALFQKSMKK